MKNVTWSEQAEVDFANNIDYLIEKWTVKDAEEFADKVAEVVDYVSKEYVQFPLMEYKGIRKAVVCKQITLFYFEKSDTEVELVRFWNSFKDETKIKF